MALHDSDLDRGLDASQAAMKHGIDLAGAIFGLVLIWWLILIAWLVASVDARANGFFRQARVGRFGKHFQIVKIRTMRVGIQHQTNVTQTNDPRITRTGAFFHRTKIDELPQLWNVLSAMSFVGPRPDVPGYADRLDDETKALMLSVRPGITGPSTLAYRKEEHCSRVGRSSAL